MKLLRAAIISTAVLGGAGLLCGGMPRTQAEPKPSEPPLIVHEWGTFTSFSGSNGVKLEFRPLQANDLPNFVMSPQRLWGQLLSKASLPAIQRMETPVTYFYTPVERDVSVSVEFPKGLLTEFYPPVQECLPNGLPDLDGDAATALKNSKLDWGTVHLIPTELLRAHVKDAELARRIGRHVESTMVPADNHGHYAAARATDSAIVQVRHTKTRFLHGDYFEKFLFYRGLGNFDLPLVLEADRQNALQLTNNGTDAIRSLFLVTVQGDQLWFKRTERIGPGSTLTLSTPKVPSTVDELAKSVVKSLVATGLYEKEAQAMVNTWRQSWFGEEGTRLFYIVPARITDELLPLQIAPRPTELVRVLVGRMEIMTPSQEQRILDLVTRSAAARKAQTEEAAPSPLLPEFLTLGRLAEPALARARHATTDGELQAEVARLIEELRAEHNRPAGG